MKSQLMFMLHHLCINIIMDCKMLVYLKYMDGAAYTKLYGRCVVGSMLIGMFTFPAMGQFAQAYGRKKLFFFSTGVNFLQRLLEVLFPVPLTMILTTVTGSLQMGNFQCSLTAIA